MSCAFVTVSGNCTFPPNKDNWTMVWTIQNHGGYHRPIEHPTLFWLSGDSFMLPVV